MSYPRAKAAAIGKARALRKQAHEIADIEAMRYSLSEKQRLRLREEVKAVFINGQSTAN